MARATEAASYRARSVGACFISQQRLITDAAITCIIVLTESIILAAARVIVFPRVPDPKDQPTDKGTTCGGFCQDDGNCPTNKEQPPGPTR